MWVQKLLLPPVRIGIFGLKTAKFGPKLAFLVNLGQGMHLVPCWCVGWWLWRAGCISQDTYLLYKVMRERHVLETLIIKNLVGTGFKGTEDRILLKGNS